jgi:hypothetical protein
VSDASGAPVRILVAEQGRRRRPAGPHRDSETPSGWTCMSTACMIGIRLLRSFTMRIPGLITKEDTRTDLLNEAEAT